MKKNKLFNFEGIINMSSIIGGSTPTCNGDQCDIHTGDANSCWSDDVKNTACNPDAGQDTGNLIKPTIYSNIIKKS